MANDLSNQRTIELESWAKFTAYRTLTSSWMSHALVPRLAASLAHTYCRNIKHPLCAGYLPTNAVRLPYGALRADPKSAASASIIRRLKPQVRMQMVNLNTYSPLSNEQDIGKALSRVLSMTLPAVPVFWALNHFLAITTKNRAIYNIKAS